MSNLENGETGYASWAADVLRAADVRRMRKRAAESQLGRDEAIRVIAHVMMLNASRRRVRRACLGVAGVLAVIAAVHLLFWSAVPGP